MKCLEVVGRRKLLFVCHRIWTHKLVVIDGDSGQRRRRRRNVAVPFLHEERSGRCWGRCQWGISNIWHPVANYVQSGGYTQSLALALLLSCYCCSATNQECLQLNNAFCDLHVWDEEVSKLEDRHTGRYLYEFNQLYDLRYIWLRWRILKLRKVSFIKKTN